MAVVEEKAKEKGENKEQRFDDEPHGSLENLPFDSVMEMEILPRLPLKSILRLELSSKPLSPLISDHLRRRYTLPDSVSGLFFSLPISAKNFYRPLDNKFIIDGTLPPSDDLVIVDCCNGLLLCRCRKINQGVVFLVCNPLTGQCASIPLYSCYSFFHNAVLAFDPHVSVHYNVLCFRSGSIKIFSSETGSWIEKKQAASHLATMGKVFLFFFNGKIYFLSNMSKIVKIFDRQGRLVGRIDLPLSKLGFGKLLGYSGGHLHLAVKVDDEMLVWILEDCDKSRWVSKYRVSLRSIFDYVTRGLGGCISLKVFHPDMDVIFIQVQSRLFSYNMDSGNFTEVCTHPWIHNLVFVYSPFYSKDFGL